MKGGGLALKSLQWFLRGVQFCCAAVVLAIFSYILATLHNHNLSIKTWIRAVEGISGIAVVYTLFGLVLLCCLAGIAIFSAIAILFDVAFSGAFVYVAWATRGGASSCRGQVNTPFGSGNTNTGNTIPSGNGGFTHFPSFHQACQLNTACFSVAIVAIFFFLFSAIVELLLIKHHKKEKAFGPGPGNNYTSGSPRRKFWQRKKKEPAFDMAGGLKPDSLPHHTTLADARTSYTTETTAADDTTGMYSKYGNTAPPVHHHNNMYDNDNLYDHQTSGVTHQPYTYNNTTGTF